MTLLLAVSLCLWLGYLPKSMYAAAEATRSTIERYLIGLLGTKSFIRLGQHYQSSRRFFFKEQSEFGLRCYRWTRGLRSACQYHCSANLLLCAFLLFDSWPIVREAKGAKSGYVGRLALSNRLIRRHASLYFWCYFYLCER